LDLCHTPAAFNCEIGYFAARGEAATINGADADAFATYFVARSLHSRKVLGRRHFLWGRTNVGAMLYTPGATGSRRHGGVNSSTGGCGNEDHGPRRGKWLE
jgi:hypothetical protein